MVKFFRDPVTLWLFGGILGVLLVATIVGQLLRLRMKGPVIDNLNARIRAWWVMSAVTCAPWRAASDAARLPCWTASAARRVASSVCAMACLVSDGLRLSGMQIP